MKSQLIISGSIAIDRIMNFSGRYKDIIKPDKIHVLSISPLLKDMKNTHGGVAGNIAYSSALLGEKPILIGSVGPDADSYIKKLSDLGVDTSSVHKSHLLTASFNVITDLDDNQVGGFYSGAMGDCKDSSFEKWKNTNNLFVVSPNDPSLMERLVKECQDFNLRLFYDFGQQIHDCSADSLLAGVKNAEIIIANDYEISLLCDKIKFTEEQLKSIVPICITTLGAKGSLIEGKNVKEPIKINSTKPKAVIDPTGAGDAFRAGFVYGYIRGYDLQICGQMGSVTAVYAVETYGTQEHFFTLQEFAKRYQENYGEKLILKYCRDARSGVSTKKHSLIIK